MKGFGIEIKNDLLEKKHVEGMGISVWFYMWLIDKMTSIDEEGVGKILGGKPIKYADVAEELGVSMRTYRRWTTMLENAGYINTVNAPYGLVITVNKAHKRFGKSYAKNGTPAEIAAAPEVAQHPAETAHLSTKSGTPNKTVQLDNTEDRSIKETPGEFARRFFGGDLNAWEDLSTQLEAAGIPAIAVQREMKKFTAYWTEPTPSGKKQLWETKPTFEVKRRLGTWFRNLAERSGTRQRAGAGTTV